MEIPSPQKLRWHCRRGMLELDLLLSRFCERALSDLDDASLCLFEQLLQYPDPDLYACLMGQSCPDNQELANLVEQIRSMCTAE